MKNEPSRVDWSVFHRAFIALSFCVVLSVGLLIGSQYYYDYLTQWGLEQRNLFAQMQAEYSQVREALEIVDTFYYDTFNKLIKERFFQEKPQTSLEEQGLQIVSEIKNVIPDLKLPSPVTYELTAKALYSKLPFSIDQQLKIYETKLILTLGLLHEGDLLKLIETIEFQRLAGLFNLLKCEIRRVQEELDVKDVSKAYFNATCVLAWYVSTIEKSEPLPILPERRRFP